MKKNIIVGQSGGPTAVINGSLYGVASEGIKKTDEIGTVYGMINGIEGFLQGNYMDLAHWTRQMSWSLSAPHRALPWFLSVQTAGRSA